MGRLIEYDCDANTERIFISKAGFTNRNISNDPVYDVFFEIKNSDSPNEKRQLIIINRIKAEKVLEVNLNDNGGGKPITTTNIHNPSPNPKLRTVTSDVDLERVFYKDIDLTDDASFNVEFRIIPNNDHDDVVRYLIFKGDGAGVLSGKAISLNSGGGKKPLGGGVGEMIHKIFE